MPGASYDAMIEGLRASRHRDRNHGRQYDRGQYDRGCAADHCRS
jgi:hypothetical protein